MVRPRKCRRIQHNPPSRFYKPQGIPLRQTHVLRLAEDGLEALLLADVRDMDHESASAMMGVSRPTFSRILAQARKIVATALCEGAALEIESNSPPPTKQQEQKTKGDDNAKI